MTTNAGDYDEPLDPEEQRLADLRRRAALRVEQEKRELLATWLDGGGTEAEFEAAWPSIHAQLGKSRVSEVGDRARRRSLNRFNKEP
ncbi:MAG TPA: hypothetical protein VMM78_16620 [Thermomicrobiales bacterium]|nr:hypothetical protein [Thermomicrobiales bacterium]